MLLRSDEVGTGRTLSVSASPVGLTVFAPGQANYAAAKAGIAAFTLLAAGELGRFGARANCIAPGARTRLTEGSPGVADMVAKPADEGAFDVFDPANVAPMAAYLARADCPLTGEVFFVQGGQIDRLGGWHVAETVHEGERRATIEGLAERLGGVTA